MRHARKKIVPALPISINALADYLDQNPERYTCCEQAFYQDRTVDNDGKTTIIFGCTSLISDVVSQGGNEVHADATFKVTPATPQSRQLFILHIIVQNHSIPIIYALMESKTEAAYTLLLTKCKALFPSIIPNCVMTDFETALQNAFLTVYPETVAHGCWFHYVQALIKNVKRLGLAQYVKDNVQAQICLKMCAALALLPVNKIDEGFQLIRRHAIDNNVRFATFFNYYSNYWLRNRGPEVFSVYGLPRRTNNNVECFHSQLKEKFQILHPNLWTFLEHLKNLSSKYHVTVRQLALGQRISRAVKIKYLLNSGRILKSTQQLDLGHITLKEFLLQCSHSAERYIREEMNWHINVEQGVIEENEDEIAVRVEDHQPELPVNILLPENPEPEEVHEWDERDFFIPEDLELVRWQEEYGNDEYPDNIPYVQIDQTLQVNLHNEETICVVCRDGARSHASVPCGHRVLCADCADQLRTNRCPICNRESTGVIRIWQ
ncbi:unnamed protein product [Macrosiphum euphorbiae]|uniref:RING-type domain-containing protein n=1 Tax=Macrosiphum euphorbiae TaxID=13131 RepID=A0AAV0WXX4_9HEMI|nr:unnamed protein product [Macrosiphum euphorbiae]